MQHLALVVAWLHWLLFWLRLKPWFTRLQPIWLCFAAVLPVPALLGSFQGGRSVQTLAADPAWRQAVLIPARVGTAQQNAWLVDARTNSWLVFATVFVRAVAARAVRS